jgi:hypothetical protein
MAEKLGTRVTGTALEKLRKEFNNKVKPGFWRAEAAKNSHKWSPENLARMRDGRPPIGSDGLSMELHHTKALGAGGSNSFDNLQIMTATEHRFGENFTKNHPDLF